jgi:hypothetical protein
MGPAKTMPVTMSGHFPCGLTPEATTPQPKAHIGGNQVMGLSSSATTGNRGMGMSWSASMRMILNLTLYSVNSNLHSVFPVAAPRARA